jgi:ADP-ribosylglycohydrolase
MEGGRKPDSSMELIDRYKGALVGLAVGDALGTSGRIQSTRHVPTADDDRRRWAILD